jgi:hypothetical protein
MCDQQLQDLNCAPNFERQVGEDAKHQHHNLFHMFLENYRVHTIIDGDSCNNLVNVEMVKKLGLTMREHPHPYYIQWFNNNGKVKVKKQQGYIFQLGLTVTLLILMWCLWMLALFCWDVLGSLILMLFTMVDLISTLSCIRARKLCCFQ